jgi:DNA-binding response OmpR family regulator
MRILVVEDQPKIAAALKTGLEQATYAVDVANTLESGKAKALAASYDACVIDRMLPDGDGTEIVSALRAAGSSTPVLLLTAKDTVPDRVEGLSAGADDYLVKPFAFAELLARLQALLRRPAEALPATLTYADLTLNPATFEVTRADTRIELSSKEFALLEYLLRNADRTVTKDAIIQHVWNFDADVLPNTVEVFIGYLRNKIDKPFIKRGSRGGALIHTVRGFGYRLGKKST